jgi:biotin synthase-like enzyme
MVGTTLLIIVLPTQSMQLFVGTDCAIAMKKPNNTKSCSYCSGREGGASRGLSRRRRRRRRGLKKKAKNYAKTGPTFAVATANTETKETKKQKSVHRNRQLQHLARYFVVCLPSP